MYACVFVCVGVWTLSFHWPSSCVSNYYTTIITGLSLSLPVSPPLSLLVKEVELNKAPSHTERMSGPM